MVLSNPFDTSTPTGSNNPQQGDDRIRELKDAIVERESQDHYWPVSGTTYNDDDTGFHKKVTLLVQTSITQKANAGILYTKDVGGKAELHYKDEDGNEIQLTNAGAIAASSIIQTIYPVGSLYITTVSTNPNTVLGFGTWEAFGAGKVLVGLDSGDSDFDTSEETGGAKTHTLTEAELPVVTGMGPISTAGQSVLGGSAGARWQIGNASSNSFGSGNAHNNVQPYIVVYMFKRTA